MSLSFPNVTCHMSLSAMSHVVSNELGTRCEYCCLVHVKKVYCVVQVLSHKCMVEYRLKLIFI